MTMIKELLCVSDEEVKKVRQLYNKTEVDIEEDINILLDWLSKQAHLPKPHDRVRLEHFLLRNKFRIEQTKTKQDNYYTFKVIYSDFFLHTDPELPVITNVRKSLTIAPMPKLLPTLERITICRFEENQEDNFNFLHAMKYIIMVWELQLSHDYACAEIYVCDLQYMTLKHVLKVDVNTLHKTFLIMQQAFAARISHIDYVNVPVSIDILLNLFKRVMDVKLFGKIRLHRDCKSLHEVMPKEYLPKDLGGDQESIKEMDDKWYKEIVLQKDFIKENAKRTSNENLRIGKPVHSDLFGTDGTFRKINLD